MKVTMNNTSLIERIEKRYNKKALAKATKNRERAQDKLKRAEKKHDIKGLEKATQEFIAAVREEREALRKKYKEESEILLVLE